MIFLPKKQRTHSHSSIPSNVIFQFWNLIIFRSFFSVCFFVLFYTFVVVVNVYIRCSTPKRAKEKMKFKMTIHLSFCSVLFCFFFLKCLFPLISLFEKKHPIPVFTTNHHHHHQHLMKMRSLVFLSLSLSKLYQYLILFFLSVKTKHGHLCCGFFFNVENRFQIEIGSIFFVIP